MSEQVFHVGWASRAGAIFFDKPEKFPSREAALKKALDTFYKDGEKNPVIIDTEEGALVGLVDVDHIVVLSQEQMEKGGGADAAT